MGFLTNLDVKITARAVIFTSLVFPFCLLFKIEASSLENETESLQDSANLDTKGTAEVNLNSNNTDLTFDESSTSGMADIKEPISSFWKTYLFQPLRTTIKQEVSYKIERPDGIKTNRSSVRLEYSKFFLNHFFLQFDTKMLAYWKNDHRSNTTDHWVNAHRFEADVSTEVGIREAFIQASFFKTSIKAGIQVLPWGNSDISAITDEISPRDNRELFVFSLDELRVGQPMLIVDQYSRFGDWSLFYIPYPAFNETPEEGTAYYYDPFYGNVVYKIEKQEKNIKGIEKNSEYGLKWKDTFGKCDISIMAANLIDNAYAYQMDAPGVITKKRWRFYLFGMTFNYAVGEFLFDGEVGIKTPKPYNDASLQIVKKNEIDFSIGIEYSLSSNSSVRLEIINNHIVNWTDDIEGIPKDRYSPLLTLSKKFFHDNLTINLLNMYNGPYNTFFTGLFTTLKWTDHLSLELNGICPITNDKKSSLYTFRDQKQVSFKIQYQL